MFASLVALDGFYQRQSTQLSADLTSERSGGSMFPLLSHIYAKTFFFFCRVKTVAKNALNRRRVVVFDRRGTHFQHNFLIDICSFKMFNTLPSDIFNFSAISSNFNLQLTKMSLWNFLVFSWTTAEFGQPERLASFVSI